MGMYTFKFPIHFDQNYTILNPGGSHRHRINLAQAAYNRMDICSIHAIASGSVTVNTWMSNIPTLPFDHTTLSQNWETPELSPVGNLWVPCSSIPEFIIQVGTNYFQQFEFVDACTFLMFEFTASDTEPKPVAFSLSICFK